MLQCVGTVRDLELKINGVPVPYAWLIAAGACHLSYLAPVVLCSPAKAKVDGWDWDKIERRDVESMDEGWGRQRFRRGSW